MNLAYGLNNLTVIVSNVPKPADHRVENSINFDDIVVCEHALLCEVDEVGEEGLSDAVGED
jgi:hypothetical protein